MNGIKDFHRANTLIFHAFVLPQQLSWGEGINFSFAHRCVLKNILQSGLLHSLLRASVQINFLSLVLGCNWVKTSLSGFFSCFQFYVIANMQAHHLRITRGNIKPSILCFAIVALNKI
ncbi:MAG: hypothetical protein BGO44_15700 [Legionella sp. 39-23]|nr:MAG: hypothetical protein BGO44_15700 [Legionella sp. 39-23]